MGNITLHFPESFGGNTSQIHYIGFKGEATQVKFISVSSCLLVYVSIATIFFYYCDIQLKRDVIATIVYELMPNPADHK